MQYHSLKRILNHILFSVLHSVLQADQQPIKKTRDTPPFHFHKIGFTNFPFTSHKSTSPTSNCDYYDRLRLLRRSIQLRSFQIRF
ncbi:hypothetical protein QVD17_06939 [Tagetes erecta]|uniref:Secreted protein n=1 Tax=Tagetes erecta TaxID=13708 RepID=A0AAD8LLM1_TARER|nr:hypothetical protein QVD17_06939 [Tagetes erecta]